MMKQYRDDLFTPQVATSDALAAAGVKLADLNNWVGRGDPPTLQLDDGERIGEGRGARFALTIATVLRLAIMTRLVAIGVAPKRASAIAFRFSHFAHGPVPGKWPKRKPGELYSEGFTFLVVSPARPTGDVVNLTAKTPAFELVRQARSGATVILNLNEVVADVRGALRLDPLAQPAATTAELPSTLNAGANE